MSKNMKSLITNLLKSQKKKKSGCISGKTHKRQLDGNDSAERDKLIDMMHMRSGSIQYTMLISGCAL